MLPAAYPAKVFWEVVRDAACGKAGHIVRCRRRSGIATVEPYDSVVRNSALGFPRRMLIPKSFLVLGKQADHGFHGFISEKIASG